MTKIIPKIILFLFVCIWGASCSTVKTPEEIAIEAKVDSIAHIHAQNALENSRFVLMAERVSIGRSGHTFTNPRGETNFVYVIDKEGVVQLALENGHMGFNGLGGFTLQGTVGKPRYKEDDKGNITMSYTLYGQGVSATIELKLFTGSDYAQAYINSTMHSGRMVVYGRVVPYSGR